MTQFPQRDNLLKQARESRKYSVLRFCLTFKGDKQSNNPSNQDIREMVVKDCISIWQKEATTRNVLPVIIKEKHKQ
jgi:hypothetical protein